MKPEKHKIGDTTISVFRSSLEDEIREFLGLADEMVDVVAELADRGEWIRKKDCQGVMGIQEQTAIAEVRDAAKALEWRLNDAIREIKEGPTVGHRFSAAEQKGDGLEMSKGVVTRVWAEGGTVYMQIELVTSLNNIYEVARCEVSDEVLKDLRRTR